MRRKHRRTKVRDLRRWYCGGGWWPASEDRVLFDPAKVGTTRYRYRGAKIPSLWPATDEDAHRVASTRLAESPVH